MTDMLAAAYKAKQTDTDYDLVDLGGDDLSKVISQIGEEAFVKLDKNKIPNSENVEAKSALATDPYTTTCRKGRLPLTILPGKTSGPKDLTS